MLNWRKISSVSGTTLKLLFRGGAAWGLLVLASGFAVFIFFSAGGGDSLVDELRIRIEYALYASTTLLNLALIYFACVSLRKEIDERRFHTISAAPVRRVEIWLGKFLGVSTMGLIAFLAISIALVFSCAFLIVGWSKPEHVRELDSKFFRTYYKCRPDLADLEKRVAKNYKKSLAEMKKRKAAEHEEHEGEEDGHHAHHHHGEWEGDEWRSRKHLLADIRKGKQIISPGATSQWRFRWSPKDNQGEYVLLRFKFYTNRKRRKSEGVWSVLNENNDVAWSGKFKGYSFVEHELRIPSKFMPKTSEFTLAYKGTSSTFVIFPVYNNGLSILYDSGGILKNFCRLLFFSAAHMAVLVALALMFSAMFSYSVAVFSTISLYAVASFSTFFHHILTDLSFHDQTFSTRLFTILIKVGLWLAEGAKSLPVNDMFANGVSIPVFELLKGAAASYIAYLLLVVIIGAGVLTRKEIDKILQA